MTSWTAVFLDVAWAPAAVIGLHLVVTTVLGHQPKLDPVLHLLGGAAGAYSLTRAMARISVLGALVPWPSRPVAIIAATMGVALVWEAGEIVSNRYFGTLIDTSVSDTLLDLALGATGAMACVAVISRQHPRPRN